MVQTWMKFFKMVISHPFITPRSPCFASGSKLTLRTRSWKKIMDSPTFIWFRAIIILKKVIFNDPNMYGFSTILQYCIIKICILKYVLRDFGQNIALGSVWMKMWKMVIFNLTPIILKLKMVDPVTVLKGWLKFYQSLIFCCRDKCKNVVFALKVHVQMH